MKIGGLQKVSLIDFPAHIAAVVFTKGCNFRCPFCFNRELVLETAPTISQTTVLNFLKQRCGLLDGVAITGGEPSLQSDLKEFLLVVKKMGYPTKIDTNGSLPVKLKKVLHKTLLDYVALDFKAPLDGRYAEAAGVDFNPAAWLSSLRLLKQSRIPFELRTTIVPGIHDQKVLAVMARQLKSQSRQEPNPPAGRAGSQSVVWHWQNFQPRQCLDPRFDERKPFLKEELDKFLKAAKRYYSAIELRPW